MINHRDEEDVLRLCPLVGATSELVGGAVEYRGERKSEKDDRKESVTFEPGDYPKPTRTTVASAVGPHQSARTNATREAGREERRLARRRVRTVICSVLAAAMLLAVALRGGLPPDGDIRSHPLPLQLEKEHDALDWGALHGQRILKKKTKEVHHHHHHVAKKVENGKNKSASSAAVAAARDVGPNREGDALLDSSAKFATVEEEGEEESSLKHSRRAKTKLYSGSHDHLAKDQSSDGSGDYSKYSCDSLYRRTDPSIPGMRCDFAKTCNGGEGIYAPVTFCSDQYSPRTVILLLALPLCLLLVILFRILGSTAEEFFSPGLEMFSLRMGLPERFAGVTLLALGNGAPDVASTVNAILDDPNNGYLLAMGELTGAAMVIGTVVAGAVAWVAPGGHGVQFGGAFVRDVLVFVLTMGVTYKCLEDRSVTRTEVWVFMGVYAGYVLVVLAADLYHRNVVEPRDREERRKMRREAKKANNEAKIIAEAYLATDAADDKAEPTAATTAKGIAELAPASETTGLLSDREHPKNKKPAVITHLVRDRGISLGSYELAKASQRKEGVGGVSGGGHKLEKVIEAFSNYDERSRDDDDVDDEDTGTDCEEGSERTSLNGAYHGLGADGNIYRAVGENNIERAGDEAAVTVPIKSGDKVGYTASSLHSSPRPTAPPPFEKSHSLCSSIENHQIAATSSGWPRRVASDGTEPLVVFHPHRYHPHHGGVMDIAHPLPHMCHHPSFDEHSVGGASTITHDGMAQHPCAGEGARSWPDAFWGCRSEFAAHWAEFWREMYGPPHVCSDFGDGCEQREGKYESEGKDNKGEFSDGVGNDNGWLDKFLLTCELPFTVLRKVSLKEQPKLFHLQYELFGIAWNGNLYTAGCKAALDTILLVVQY
uniref:Sodium/calcium exchanger membrane region domain-containing protein n=1 Tax=Odontella aurita TaxID=265563 RepID=A0A7S4JWE0_9STRA|mmetsp:Transcript_55127/g.165144  ORF Transcript_55127/g.165144 Transcript_55127/m.165144 type:complete len:885 (+) Transcript_55127:466-3120(+)